MNFSFDKIKEIIQSDYNQLEQLRVAKGGRNTMKTFYLNYARALKELQLATGPFITTKEQFIEQIKYLEGTVSKEVYKNIIQYCQDKLKLNI